MSTLNKQRACQLCAVALCTIILSATASAQDRQIASVIASGGGLAVGNGIVANTTIGQPIIGPAKGAGTTVSQGFWFAPRAAGPTLGIEDQDGGSSSLAVTVFPNPCRENATVNIVLPMRSEVSVRLYDDLGNERALLYERETGAGDLRISLNATTMSAGHYMIRVIRGSSVHAVPLLIVH